MDFNHTSSHFTYAYDTNIHVWVWHEWEVWLELCMEDSTFMLRVNNHDTKKRKRIAHCKISDGLSALYIKKISGYHIWFTYLMYP